MFLGTEIKTIYMFISSTLGGTIPQWITPEVLNMFMFHELRPLSAVEELNIVQTLVIIGLIYFMLSVCTYSLYHVFFFFQVPK